MRACALAGSVSQALRQRAAHCSRTLAPHAVRPSSCVRICRRLSTHTEASAAVGVITDVRASDAAASTTSAGPAAAGAAVPAGRSPRSGGRSKRKEKEQGASDASDATAESHAGGNRWSPIRGTHDSLSAWSARQRSVESLLAALASQYCYGELRTPVLERADLCSRSLGAESDVVSKEMFRFDDHGTQTVLRPEATASVVRALLHAGLISATPAVQRYWYTGPMFRRERPQAGRYRQFLQFGVEMVGSADVGAEVEVIGMAQQSLRRLGLLPYVKLELNSLGDSSSRAAYVAALTTFLQQHASSLSPDSQARLARGSVLRILDSKEPQDQAVLRGEVAPAGDGATTASSSSPATAAPLLRDFLSPSCASRFDLLQSSLRAAGIAFHLNPFLVRGLDYYAHACFEFVMDEQAIAARMKQLQQQQQQQQRGGGKKGAAAPAVPAKSTVLAGGRYDGLFHTLGGPTVPAIGWAAGIDRLLLLTDLVQPGVDVALPLPTPVGIVINNEPVVAKDAPVVTNDGAAATPAAAAHADPVTLEQAYAALCTFVRDGCVLLSPGLSPASLSPATLHAPSFSVVQSFHPNMWKALKQVTKAPEEGSPNRAAGQPPMLAVLLLGAEDVARNQVQLRDQRTREQSAVKLEELGKRLCEAMHASGAKSAVLPPPAPDAAPDAPLTFETLRNAYRANA